VEEPMITVAGEPDDIKMFGVKFDLPRSRLPESIDRTLLGYRETRGKTASRGNHQYPFWALVIRVLGVHRRREATKRIKQTKKPAAKAFEYPGPKPD
jgi:hypothetical protein